MQSRLSSMRPCALLLAAALCGCSVVTSLDEYDRGTGGASSASTGGPASGTASGGAGVGGSGGAGGTGVTDCSQSIYPAAETLVDTFDGDPTFFGCATQVGGELRVDLPDSGDFYCTSTSELPYCLTSSSFTFKIAEAATAGMPGMQTWIILRAANDSGSISLLVESDALGLKVDVAGGEDIPIPNPTYDPFANVWFRLQGDGGDLVLSTSPDAEAWTERGRGPSVLGLDGVFLELGANRYFNRFFPESASLPAETARFDCLNAPDCP